MNKKTKQKIIELFKSGNFSIITWDNDLYSIYDKKGLNVDNYDDSGEPEPIYECDDHDGYLHEIVSLLSEALGGDTSSI